MIFFSSIENCLVMHHLLNDQICTMVISCHKLDDQVYGIERVVIYRQSLRSSLRYGLSTPYRLTIRNSARLFHIVLFNMGDMHLVLPALNLSTLNTDILIMMQ